MATGATLTFLDSHIEALQGWVQPLLHRIAMGSRNVAMPIIDSIDADTFEACRAASRSLPTLV